MHHLNPCVLTLILSLSTGILNSETFNTHSQDSGVKISFPGVPYTWTAPCLEEPKGKILRISSARELEEIVRGDIHDTTVLLADGIYHLDRPLILDDAHNLTIRSAKVDRDKVIIKGPGMAHVDDKPKFSAINWSGTCSGLQVANLTVRDFPYHGIHISGKDVHLYNCHFVDIGQQLVKVNANGDTIPDKGIMEYCLVEYADRLWGGNYTQGISIVRGKNWLVRHCVFRNIRAARDAGLGGPAILMWGGSTQMAAIGNVMIDCDCGIAFGIGENQQYPYHVDDGLIASNVFVRNKVDEVSDYGIAVSNGKNIRVIHNTVWNPVKNNLNWSFEYRFDCDDLLFANNLGFFKIEEREGKHTNIRIEGNIVNTDPSWFKRIEDYDLHLSKKAIGALGKAVEFTPDPNLPNVDVDGDTRPAIGDDIGADKQ